MSGHDDRPEYLGAILDVTERRLSEEALRRSSEIVEAKLANFGIQGKVVAVRPGPVEEAEAEPAEDEHADHDAVDAQQRVGEDRVDEYRLVEDHSGDDRCQVESADASQRVVEERRRRTAREARGCGGHQTRVLTEAETVR